MNGYLVVQDGPVFPGVWLGGASRGGEVVFNTSHNGYEEIATDPSYFGQVMVMCAPQQGNYGVDDDFWESNKMWIRGFVCLDMTIDPEDDKSWVRRLTEADIPVLSEVDTRSLVLYLREQGTKIGAMVQASSENEAKEKAQEIFSQEEGQDWDWAHRVSREQAEKISGQRADGHKIALIDFGCKSNILRELSSRCREVMVFPSRASAEEIMAYGPQGVLLSNGPGDPENVEGAVETIQSILGKIPIFGICMGHQLLARALGAKTFKLKFGHRGANHPVKNILNGEICVTSQNHGYAIDENSIPQGVTLSHKNLNDQTVSGIECRSQKCFSVQFHPESHPGPRDADNLFDQFIRWIDDDLR